MKIKIIIFVLLMFIISLFTGCTSRNVESSYKQFKESFILATDFLQTSNDSLEALKNMDEKLVKIELQKMKDSMDKIKKELHTKDDKGIYSNMDNAYKSVDFLLKAYGKIDKLTIEEKANVYTEAGIVEMYRSDIKNGDI